MGYIDKETLLSWQVLEDNPCGEDYPVIYPHLIEENVPELSKWDIAIEAINEIKKNSDLPDTWRGALTLTIIMLKKVRQRKSKIEIELDKREYSRKNEYHE